MSSASEPPYPRGEYPQGRPVPPAQPPARTARALPAAPAAPSHPGADDEWANVETTWRTSPPGAGGRGDYPPPGSYPGTTSGTGGYPGTTGGYPGTTGGPGGYQGSTGGPGGYPAPTGAPGGYQDAGNWFNPPPTVRPDGQGQAWQDLAGQGGHRPAADFHHDGYPRSAGGYPGTTGSYPGSAGG